MSTARFAELVSRIHSIDKTREMMEEMQAGP